MRVQEADENRQRTRADNDVDTDDGAKPGPGVPEAWRNKRFRISVIAAAVILAAGSVSAPAGLSGSATR
jgi:hypothetical protein